MLSGRGPTQVVNTELVLGDFFQTLGVEAARGRLFAAGDTKPGAESVAVLSYASWQRRFGGDPAILGQAVVLDGRSFTIAGVLPSSYAFPDADTELFVPMGAFSGDLPWNDRDSSFGTRALARLKLGVTLAAADADMQRVWREVGAAAGKPVAKPLVKDMRAAELGSRATSGRLAALAVLLLYGLATANAVHLALARAEERRGELSVRTALGASRAMLLRLLAWESLTLALATCVLGGVLAWGALRLAGPLLADATVPTFLRTLRIDSAVAATIAVLALLSGLVLTLVPAIASQGQGPRPAASPSRTRRFLRPRQGSRAGLLVTEVAITVILVTLASLLTRSETLVGRVDKGFDVSGVYATRIVAPNHHFATEAAWQSTYERLVEGARRLPGVEHAAATLTLPLSHRSWEMRIQSGQGPMNVDKADSVLFNLVSEDSLATLGVPLLRGRGFTSADRVGAPLVAMVDETMAARYWPNQNPIGQRVVIEAPAKDANGNNMAEVRTVVGVTSNVRHYALETPSRIQIYIPLAQSNGRFDIELELAVRGQIPPGGFESELRQMAAAIDPELALSRPGFVSRFVDAAMGPRRQLARLFSAFGLLALILAAAGVFAVITHSVAQRRAELGIRSALGADGRRLLLHVLRGAMWSGTVGILLGAASGAASSTALRSVLFGVGPFDPRALGLSAVVVLAAVALAALAPALQASRVQPAKLLSAGDRVSR